MLGVTAIVFGWLYMLIDLLLSWILGTHDISAYQFFQTTFFSFLWELAPVYAGIVIFAFWVKLVLFSFFIAVIFFNLGRVLNFGWGRIISKHPTAEELYASDKLGWIFRDYRILQKFRFADMGKLSFYKRVLPLFGVVLAFLVSSTVLSLTYASLTEMVSNSVYFWLLSLGWVLVLAANAVLYIPALGLCFFAEKGISFKTLVVDSIDLAWHNFKTLWVSTLVLMGLFALAQLGVDYLLEFSRYIQASLIGYLVAYFVYSLEVVVVFAFALLMVNYLLSKNSTTDPELKQKYLSSQSKTDLEIFVALFKKYYRNHMGEQKYRVVGENQPRFFSQAFKVGTRPESEILFKLQRQDKENDSTPSNHSDAKTSGTTPGTASGGVPGATAGKKIDLDLPLDTEGLFTNSEEPSNSANLSDAKLNATDNAAQLNPTPSENDQFLNELEGFYEYQDRLAVEEQAADKPTTSNSTEATASSDTSDKKPLGRKISSFVVLVGTAIASGAKKFGSGLVKFFSWLYTQGKNLLSLIWGKLKSLSLLLLTKIKARLVKPELEKSDILKDLDAVPGNPDSLDNVEASSSSKNSSPVDGTSSANASPTSNIANAEAEAKLKAQTNATSAQSSADMPVKAEKKFGSMLEGNTIWRKSTKNASSNQTTSEVSPNPNQAGKANTSPAPTLESTSGTPPQKTHQADELFLPLLDDELTEQTHNSKSAGQPRLDPSKHDTAGSSSQQGLDSLFPNQQASVKKPSRLKRFFGGKKTPEMQKFQVKNGTIEYENDSLPLTPEVEAELNSAKQQNKDDLLKF